MEDLSNKTMVMFLLATVVISLFSTMLILGKSGEDFGPTGFAPTSTGIVNLSVATTVSITTNESSLINFGSCTLNESRAINLTSYNTEDSVAYCLLDNLPNNISVRNDGNVIVNVTIATSACAPGAGNQSCTFLNLTTTPQNDNGLFSYNISNMGRNAYTGGCGTINSTAGGWTHFNGTNGLHACTNLATATTANSFVTNFRLRVPKGLSTGLKQVTITYFAFQG